MRIIDKIKDSYDFLMGTIGTDNLVVYDRRGSKALNSGDYNLDDGIFFVKEKNDNDTKKIKLNYWASKKYKKSWWNVTPAEKKRGDKYIYEGKVYHFILEIGYIDYVFEIERYIDDNDELQLDVNIILKRRVSKDERISDSPMSFAPCYLVYGDKFEIHKSFLVRNPILKNTYIPGIIGNTEI